MTGVFDAFFGRQQACVPDVPGGAKGVGMSGLAPFGVRFLMAVSTLFGSGEGFGIYELAGVCGGVRRQEGLIGAESEVVMFFDCFGVDRPLGRRGDDIRGVGSVSFPGDEK